MSLPARTFTLWSSQNQRKFFDGTSKTLAIGERTYIFQDWTSGVTRVGNPPTLVCIGASSNVTYPINADQSKYGYYVGHSSAPPGAKMTMLLNDLYFGSYHSGGAQFCCADGSVHMLIDSLDFNIFCRATTIAGDDEGDFDP